MSVPFVDVEAILNGLNIELARNAGGALGDALSKVIFNESDSTKPVESSFFKPFTTKEDLHRIYTPITAPVAFAFLACEMTLGIALNIIGFGLSALFLNPKGMAESSKKVLSYVAKTLIFALAAIISPVVNLVDLVGSAIVTACKSDVEATEVTSTQKVTANATTCNYA